jgi:hypothetical protein
VPADEELTIARPALKIIRRRAVIAAAPVLKSSDRRSRLDANQNTNAPHH